jgi:DNA-binding MarR family transcriptional regulator
VIPQRGRKSWTPKTATLAAMSAVVTAGKRRVGLASWRGITGASVNGGGGRRLAADSAAETFETSVRVPYTSGTEMNDADDTRHTAPAAPGGDVTDELARLLPELAVALYESTPHHKAGGRAATAEPLTGRQLEAVVFLSHHRRVTMGEFADGLGVSRAAASELVARLIERDVARREADPADRRVVYVRLAGAAERYADAMHDEWRAHLDAVFARYSSIDPDTLVAFLGDLIDQLKGRAGT